MVLCELMSSAPESFLSTWALLTGLGMISVMFFSGPVFWFYYVCPTYERWCYKINPKFPSAEDVRLEVIQTVKGLMAGTFAPSMSLYLSQHGMSYAYCGVGEFGWLYLLVTFFVCWIVADLFEFSYHYLGHSVSWMWQVHRHHHRFYNPSPFSVIADEPVDQFVRAMPMLLFPLVAPVNMDLLFSLFGVFFYAYGVYLHWGYEFESIDAHCQWINTSYHHYAHHALSIKNKPYHTGFYIQLWDKIMGSTLEKCRCSKCARAKGERSFEAWEKLDKPDYSKLLSPCFWLEAWDEKKV